jgi:hypothetical protein
VRPCVRNGALPNRHFDPVNRETDERNGTTRSTVVGNTTSQVAIYVSSSSFSNLTMMVAFSLFCFVPLLLKQSALRTNVSIHKTIVKIPFASVGRPRSLIAATNDDFLPAVREAVLEAGGEASWKESTEALSRLFDIKEAELYLADAFGWKGWAKASEMTKKYQRTKLPDAVKIIEALEWLREGPLELNEEQMQSSIEKYPKTYLDAPNESYRKAMGTAPRKYRDNLKELIRQDPTVLQVTYNCDGEGCASECGSCWVSYESRLSIKSSESMNW